MDRWNHFYDRIGITFFFTIVKEICRLRRFENFGSILPSLSGIIDNLAFHGRFILVSELNLRWMLSDRYQCKRWPLQMTYPYKWGAKVSSSHVDGVKGTRVHTSDSKWSIPMQQQSCINWKAPRTRSVPCGLSACVHPVLHVAREDTRQLTRSL